MITDSPSRPEMPGLSDTVDDVLVFEQTERGFSLLGGTGRGAGWAGIVDVDAAPGSLVGLAWQRGTLVRQSSDQAVQIVGPYYARHAIAAPVGHNHVVVLGSDRAIDLLDGDVLKLAAASVDTTQGLPADKLLADELELVHALRTLMAYRAETVADTLRHIASVAAMALSCEVALIRLDGDEDPIVEAVSFEGETPLVDARLEAWLSKGRLGDKPRLDQKADSGTWPFGVDVASHLTIPIGQHPRLGALAVGHARSRPRGFTALCQRIGRAVAEAAELLITQAMAREQLAAERDLLARISGTDALTGIANRRAWDEAAAEYPRTSGPPRGSVLTCDLDGLKQANDRFGHIAGDALIRATANLLNSCVREGDLVARMGGDEFSILLSDADSATARDVRARIRRAERRWRVTEYGLAPRLSIGSADIIDGDVEVARRQADERMFANKRRRRRAGTGIAPVGLKERRRT
jgi:diguanylate cyclase (GGDEF)-like protein